MTKAEAQAEAAAAASRSIHKATGRTPEAREIRILTAMLTLGRPVMPDEFARVTRGGLRTLEKAGLIEWHADGWHLSK